MADEAAKAADRAARELARIERALIEQIKKLTAKLDVKQGELVSDREARANASKIRGQIVRAMEEQGVQSVAQAADRFALEAAEAVARELDFGEFEPDVAREIEQIINGQMKEVADSFSKGAEDIGEAMRIGVTGGRDLQVLIQNVADTVSASFSKAQAAVDSAIMGAGRKVQNVDAQDAQEAQGERMVAVLLGPLDSLTRPFCREWVGKGVYLDDLDSLENDQIEPVSVFAGGYQCRHSYAYFSESLAIEKGYKIVEV